MSTIPAPDPDPQPLLLPHPRTQASIIMLALLPPLTGGRAKHVECPLPLQCETADYELTLTLVATLFGTEHWKPTGWLIFGTQ